MAHSDHQVTNNPDFAVQESWPQPHNSINRLTGTTGEGFAPYTMRQIGFAPGLILDVHAVFDPARLGQEELRNLFADMGMTGFGRDASIGLGKFAVEDNTPTKLAGPANANAYLTLAPARRKDVVFCPPPAAISRLPGSAGMGIPPCKAVSPSKRRCCWPLPARC